MDPTLAAPLASPFSSEISVQFLERIQQLSIQFVPFVMAVVFHEYAHGFVAKRWGDRTAEDAGRLTLNPLPHLDPIGTVLFPLINMLSGMNLLFGWARPVPIDPRNFTRFRPALFWVSLAGPAMNFLLAIGSAALFCVLTKYVSEDFYLFEPLATMAVAAVSLNYALGIFNLIPLPPLDGSKVVQSFLPAPWILRYERIAPFSFFILMALLLAGAFAVLGYPIRFLTGFTLETMARLFGLGAIL
jgi:Zn-dependent protease